MTWAEFRRWAQSIDRHVSSMVVWRVANATGRFKFARTGTGSGNRLNYDVTHQRRVAVWLRARDLVSDQVISEWVDAAESHHDGWLVNTGNGVEWRRELTPNLIESGFLGVRCGV